MRSMRIRTRMLVLGLGVLITGAAAVSAQPAAEKRYVTTTIRGTLTYPESGLPMAGALLRFTPTEPGLATVQVVTNQEGSFAAEGLGFGVYAVELQTAEGEVIRGVNALPVREGVEVEVSLVLSDRVRSSTSLENVPERFMAVVDLEPKKWKRFWTEFAIFWAVAIGTGAVMF